MAESFGRMSAREKRLIAGLVLLALILAPLKAFEMRSTALADNEAAQTELAAAMLKARRAGGQGVAAELAAARSEIRDWSWSAPSVAVGQVLAQDELTEIAVEGGFAGVEARPVGKPELAGPVSLVGVELVAPFSWSGLAGFLNGLAATEKGFVLDSVTMTEDKEPKVKIVVRLPVAVSESEAEPA